MTFCDKTSAPSICISLDKGHQVEEKVALAAEAVVIIPTSQLGLISQHTMPKKWQSVHVHQRFTIVTMFDHYSRGWTSSPVRTASLSSATSNLVKLLVVPQELAEELFSELAKELV